MKSTIKFLLKIFIVTALLFGIMLVIPELFSNQKIEIKEISIKALIFGLLMTIILGLLQMVKMKKNGIRNASDLDFKVSQKSTFTSKLTLNEIFDELKTKYKSINLTSEKIIIRTSISLYSWGENIEITKGSTNDFEYEITSKPQLPTTLIDYGKNSENILKIKKIINNFA